MSEPTPWIYGPIYNCRRFNELASLARERPLTWLQSLRMSLHRQLCPPCRRYEAQWTKVEAFLQEELRRQPNSSLSAEAKAKLGLRLAEEIARKPELNDSGEP